LDPGYQVIPDPDLSPALDPALKLGKLKKPILSIQNRDEKRDNADNAATNLIF
jgi:hypothetical protein